MTNIEQSSTTYIYPSSYRLGMKEEVQKVNEALEKRKTFEATYKTLPTVAFKDLVVGREYGIAYTANNSQYYETITIKVVNPKSARVQRKDGSVFPFSKATKQNRIFELRDFTTLPEDLDQCERVIDSYMRGKINEIWKEKIAAAEEQHKKDGVYEESTTYLIDFSYPNYLRPVQKNFGISV